MNSKQHRNGETWLRLPFDVNVMVNLSNSCLDQNVWVVEWNVNRAIQYTGKKKKTNIFEVEILTTLVASKYCITDHSEFKIFKGEVVHLKKNSQKPSSKASRILIGFVLYGTHQCFQKFAKSCRKVTRNFVHGFSSYHVRRLISAITQQVTCCCTKHIPIGTIWSLQG